MMRALFSGVSGLRSHQFKLDVLGNNIANINTVGYKGGRVIFSEALTQLIAGSSKSADGGFTNPMQVGLGMTLGSIDTQFSQGALESTGNLTDLAIEGPGFFVVSSGNKRHYTRGGSFFFGADGKLVNSDGLAVQGWMAGVNSFSQGTPLLGDITLDQNMVSQAVATQNVVLSGNLDAGLVPIAEAWTAGSAFTGRATVTGTALAVPLNVAAGTNDQFVIEIDTGTGSPISEELTMTAGSYASADQVVAEINSQIAANGNLAGEVEAVNAGGAVKMRSLGNNTNTTLTVKSGTNDVLTDLGFSDGDTGSAGGSASSATEINDLLQVSTALVSGDIIQIVGTNPDGSDVSTTFAYGTDGTTLGDLLTAISDGYSGVTPTLVDGKLVLTDDVAGESDTTISLVVGSSNVGEISVPGFTNTTAGFTGTSSASIIVYDSLGGSHTLLMEFTKSEKEGEWTWAVSTSSDEEVVSGGSGKVTFDAAGNLTAFTYDAGVDSITINPGNGASAMTIKVDADGGDGFSGLSQFDSISTLVARDQDGRAVGTLSDVTIGTDGSIVGFFSNGENVTLAQIAVAEFSNPGGLVKTGEGIYEASGGSGEPKISREGSEMKSSVISGALEMSNVDLAREFTEMITAQRGFQANARLITTADQILEEVVRLKR